MTQETLNIDEAAKWLKTSPTCVMKDMKMGLIECFTLPGGRVKGGKYRFTERQLEDFIKNCENNRFTRQMVSAKARRSFPRSVGGNP